MSALISRVCPGFALAAMLLVVSGCGGGGEERAARPGRSAGSGADVSGVWVVENLGVLELSQEAGENFDLLRGYFEMATEWTSVRYSAAGRLTPPDQISLDLSYHGIRVMGLRGTLKDGKLSGEILDAEGGHTGEWSASRQ